MIKIDDDSLDNNQGGTAYDKKRQRTNVSNQKRTTVAVTIRDGPFQVAHVSENARTLFQSAMSEWGNQSGVRPSALSPAKHFRRNSAPGIESLGTESLAEFKARLEREKAAPTPSPTVSQRTRQHRLNAAQEQRMYHDSCQRLLGHITSVMGICEDLRLSNKKSFPIRYPLMHRPNDRPLPQRSQTMAMPGMMSQEVFETASQPDIGCSSSSVIDQVRRSSIYSMQETSSPFARQADQSRLLNSEFGKDLNILSIDLKMGHSSADLRTLEGQSISNLLDERLGQCLRHLDNLHNRVADTSSKVLITGDLNSGKSTFVNALLKRDLLPADQQPCTSMFCEVLDAMLNDGVEAAHAIPDPEKYNRLDPSTYHVIEMRHLFRVVADEGDKYKMLKIYANDARSTEESLLHNGVVDIALIDSPGLNTDSVKTTAVFARQEEIDVVVFVVSAENHFTLSVGNLFILVANGYSCATMT